jgi:hypothetical protein
MTTTALKKEITKAIDSIEDENFLQAIYTIINNRNPRYDFELSDEVKQILMEQEAEYKSGKAITYTKEQVRKMVLKNLGK